MVVGDRCHDYEPSWDYPVVEIESLDEIDPMDRDRIGRIVSKAKSDLAPAMGFEGFDVFFVEACGIHGGQSVAVYCSGTSSHPVVGFDLTLMRQGCEDEAIGFLHQFEISLAHELAHAYQESIGLDHDHEDGLDEDDAETFARDWADYRSISLHLLDRCPSPTTIEPTRPT